MRNETRMLRPANREVAGMFDRISHTYDFLNRFFSLGVDRRWRALAIRHLGLKPGLRMLDCSAGTGDMALSALDHEPQVKTVLLDPAQAMLQVADSKAGITPPRQYRLVRGAAEGLPFADASFDRFTVAFGIRNFADLEYGMRELHRVLRPGGRGAILEFTPDRAPVIDHVFRWYMVAVMQTVGALVSRDRHAYAYLSRTVQSFATSAELQEMFTQVGFHCRENRRLSLGIARLFILERP